MKLRALVEGLGDIDNDVEITGVQSDSRAVKPGELFVAIKGLRFDGHEFSDVAVAQGAAAIVCERKLDVKIPQVIVGDSTKALGIITGRWFGDPAKQMTLIGVTGTNGKTTTTYLVESILQ